MKVTLLTLGCRVNQSESSVLEGTLKENGISIVNLSEKPDFCIINTCTVTAKSDYNSRQLIRRAARSGAKVIVTGCYSELKPTEVRMIPGVSNLIENKRKYEIVKLITSEEPPLFFGNFRRSRPYLKVQDGCNFRCSYCSVPLARGRSRSISVEEAVRRAQFISERGYNEIVLTGVHLGTYGFDLDQKSNITDLIKKILTKTGIFRIRLSSLEINEVNDELIELLQEDRICKHLHLPLQSGSDKVLNAMKRRYTVEHFSRKLEAVWNKVKNISLGTDVIVGFPEEREEEFFETYNLLSDLPFSYLHIFPFSVRPGTEAAHMNVRTHQDVVKKRIEKLRALNAIKKERYMKAQIGRKLDVIIEEKFFPGTVCGTSGNYVKVAVSPEQVRGSVVFVRPTRVAVEMLEGVAIC